MKVIDEERQTWFLFEHNGKLFLDAFCSHSYFDYSYMIELSPEEIKRYQDEGRAYLSKLAHNIHNSAPIVKGSNSIYKGRDVSKKYSAQSIEAVQRWNDNG